MIEPVSGRGGLIVFAMLFGLALNLVAPRPAMCRALESWLTGTAASIAPSRKEQVILRLCSGQVYRIRAAVGKWNLIFQSYSARSFAHFSNACLQVLTELTLASEYVR